MKHKVWHDRKFAEEWSWNGQRVLRFRMLASYPWNYRVGEFTTTHQPYAIRRDRAMTFAEIAEFKAAKIARFPYPQIGRAHV